MNGRHDERKNPKSELLVTFEVVARHESYTRAAEELALTQSAVFRQVTALEEFYTPHYLTMPKNGFFLNALKALSEYRERDSIGWSAIQI
jgi:hypothetical protein